MTSVVRPAGDYVCPHCGWLVELSEDIEDEWHQRVRHLTEHAFEDGFECPIEVLGDIDVIKFRDGAGSWTCAADKVREAIRHLVGPAARDAVGLCLALLRDGALGQDIADTAQGYVGGDKSEDPEVKMLEWIDMKYPRRKWREHGLMFKSSRERRERSLLTGNPQLES